jgi:topoisomerase-4 subunit A
VLDRIHILEGRMLVLLNIDEVIRIIRESDEPKPALIEAFRLSDRQAEDILEIRLRQLARLEAIKIEQELAKLRDEQAEAGRAAEVRDDDAPSHHQGNRAGREAVQPGRQGSAPHADPGGQPCRRRGEGGRRAGDGDRVGQGLGAHASGPRPRCVAVHFKAGDNLYGTFECRTVDTLLAFGSNGRVLGGRIGPAGRAGDGVPVTTLIDLAAGTQIAHTFAGAAEQRC